MRKIIGQAIVVIALAIGMTTSAQPQNSQANYLIPGHFLRGQYEDALRMWDSGAYVTAYAELYLYFSAASYSGIFNQNRQFEQQVRQALGDLGNYLWQAISERDNLQNQLQACQQSRQGYIGSRSSGLKQPPTNQLPRVPPMH
jgi:hypothetical protein